MDRNSVERQTSRSYQLSRARLEVVLARDQARDQDQDLEELITLLFTHFCGCGEIWQELDDLEKCIVECWGYLPKSDFVDLAVDRLLTRKYIVQSEYKSGLYGLTAF